MEADEKTCPQCAETVKSAAVVCKHCGYNFASQTVATARPAPAAKSHKARNGCLGVLVILVILTVIGALSGHGSGSTSTPSADQTASATPAIEINARDLDAEYDANEAAAQQKYGDATLMVSGVINSINLDMTNDVYLVLNGNNMFLGPQAHLSDASKGQAPSLTKGQKVKLRCTGAKYIIKTVMLSDCDLQ